MKLRTLAAAAACALATIATAGAASAELITFDDLTTQFGTISNGYAGLDWNNFGSLDGSTFAACNNVCGFVTGAVSAPNVAYNGAGQPASFSRATTFTLNSFYLTAAWHALDVTVTGLRNGVVEDTASFSVDTSGPTLETLNWSGVDEVDFATSSSFTKNNQLVLDNVNVAIPEPATWAMLILGVAMVGFAARRRRESAALAA